MKIAEQTNGKYFRATNADKLARIYEEIDELEKTQFNVIKYQRKTEAYFLIYLSHFQHFFLKKLFVSL